MAGSKGMTAFLAPRLRTEPVEMSSPSSGTSSDEEVETAGSPKSGDLMLPPKADSEVLVLADGVTKQILKGGHGEYPTKHATCFGMLQDTVKFLAPFRH